MSGSQLETIGSILPASPMEPGRMCLRIAALKHRRRRHLSTNSHLFLVEGCTNDVNPMHTCMAPAQMDLVRHRLCRENQMEGHSVLSRWETSSTFASRPPPRPQSQAGMGREGLRRCVQAPLAVQELLPSASQLRCYASGPDFHLLWGCLLAYTIRWLFCFFELFLQLTLKAYNYLEALYLCD